MYFKLLIKNVPLYLLLLCITLSSSCTKTHKIPKASKGVINLIGYKFDKVTQIELNGEWEFYNGQLLEPNDFKHIKKRFITVPGAWNKQLKYLDIKPEKYGTYRLQIKISSKPSPLVLRIPRIFSSYKIWVNKKLYKEVGKVDKNKINYIADLKLGLIGPISLSKDETEIELIIQIANYKDPNSGIMAPISIGNYSKIFDKELKILIEYIIILSIIFVIGLYHLILFMYRKNDTSTIIFAILAFFLVIYGVVTNDTLLKNITNISFESITRFTHIVVSIYPALITIFFYRLFSSVINKRLVIIITILSIILISVSLFSDIYTVRSIISLKVIFILFTLAYFTFYGIPKAIIKKQQGAIWAFIGILFLFAVNINDMLFALGIIKTAFLSIYGFALYIIFQAINIAERFSVAFKNNEKLNKKLDFQKKNLEKTVYARTKKIEAQKNELELVNLSLNTQKRKIESKNEEINSSIRYAKTLQKSILPSNENISKIFNSFVIYIPKHIVSGDFIWYSQSSSQKIIAVVDCTGHGVPGAFMSIIGHSILNQIVNDEKIYNPSLILEKMDIKVKKMLRTKETDTDDGMDVCLCLFDKISNEKTKLIFSTAKRPIIYHMKNKNIIKSIRTSARPIGGKYFDNIDFVNQELILNKGDMIYLTSDGFVDQNRADRKRFGTKKLLNLLKSISNFSTIKQKTILIEHFRNHKKNEELRDDVTIVGIKI